MLQVFQRHIASVCFVSSIFRHTLQAFWFGCCICFHTYVTTVCSKMFHLFQSSVQQVFSGRNLQMFYLDVAYVFTHMLQVYVLNVSPIFDVCCKCFIWMLHMLKWLYIYVANVCFNCFTLFQYVVTGATPHTLWLMGKHVLHQTPLPHQTWSPTVEHAASLTHVHVRCAPFLSRIRAHALCSLSHWGTHAVIPLSHMQLVSLALGHARCALSFALG
jgi:hypothetical protein